MDRFASTPQPPRPAYQPPAVQSPTPATPAYQPPASATPNLTGQSGTVAPPTPTNVPSTAPAWSPGNAYSTNAAWAYRVANEYNPTMNQNLMDNYNTQLDNYKLNGNKRWVGDNINGHWITDAPVAPIFTNVDYNDQFNYANENMPGMREYGGTSQGNTGFLDAYTKQDPSYNGTLTPFTTMNTNLNPGYSQMIPNTGRVNTVTNPQGMTPSQLAATGFVQPGTYLANTGNNLAPSQFGQPAPGGQQQSQNGNMSGLANMTSLMSLLALLGGAPQGQGQSPFFNNQRSLFYPNTSTGDSVTQAFNNMYGGQAPNQAQGSTNPIIQLLTTLLGGK